jgi:hypothetical protein
MEHDKVSHGSWHVDQGKFKSQCDKSSQASEKSLWAGPTHEACGLLLVACTLDQGEACGRGPPILKKNKKIPGSIARPGSVGVSFLVLRFEVGLQG